jgi:1-acyl-sn-glycerol-3-phosphate acyltransferase
MMDTSNTASTTMNAHPSPDRPSVAKSVLAVAGHAGYLGSLVGLVIVSTIVLLPLAILPRVRQRLANAMLRGFLKFFVLRYLPAVRACRITEVSHVDPSVSAKPVVYVANHRSSIDAILLLAILPPTSLVIKSRHVRKIGYACLVAFFDFVSMRAGNPSGVRRSMDKCRRLMSNGMSLLIFPEGRRTSSIRLMPFADFAFRMAAERGVPIVPVVIQSDRPFLNRQGGSYFPPETVQYRIRFLEPIHTLSERDPGRLSDIAAHRMAAELAIMDRTFRKPALEGMES